MTTGDPRDWPGVARDKTTLVAELAELEAIITEAPHAPFCQPPRHRVLAPEVPVIVDSKRLRLRLRPEAWNAVAQTNPVLPLRQCSCWRGRALRIIRYGVR